MESYYPQCLEQRPNFEINAEKKKTKQIKKEIWQLRNSIKFKMRKET